MFGRAAALVAALLLASTPAIAAFDLFAQHEVTVQFATQEGKPLADTAVQVFAPGGAARPDLAGHTDRNGRFEFPTDQDGFWIAQAQSGKEVVRVMVRVGGGAGQKPEQPLSPYWAFGGLLVLLVLAVAFRIMRARLRRRQPQRRPPRRK
jgi:hypothetical protein